MNLRVAPLVLSPIGFPAPSEPGRSEDASLGGNRRLRGMPAFQDRLTVEDSQALHAFVIDQAWKAYEETQRSDVR